jgi:hypothetical protein
MKIFIIVTMVIYLIGYFQDYNNPAKDKDSMSFKLMSIATWIWCLVAVILLVVNWKVRMIL